MKSRLILILCFITILLFTACQDDPTAVGNNIIPDGDNVVIDSIDTRDLSFNSYLRTREVDSIDVGSAIYLNFGKYEHFNSNLYLRYLVSLPDSDETDFMSSYDNIDIEEAYITLSKLSTYGDDNGEFGVNGYEVTSFWDDVSLLSDSLEITDVDMSKSVVSNMTETDSTISFSVDTDLVKEWLKYSVSDSLASNYGVMVEPTTASNRAFILYSRSLSASVLTVIYQNQEELTDTVETEAYADAHLFSGTPATSDNDDSIVIQGGFPYRLFMDFNIDYIPEYATVHKATLVLATDTTLGVKGNAIVSRLYASVLDDTTRPTVYSFDGATRSLVREGNYYKGDITRYIQEWQGSIENNGLMIYLMNDFSEAEQAYIFNDNVNDSALKPHLEIVYSYQK